MEITKLSTKGQIVIPEAIRRGLGVGTSFAITRKKDLIILKKLKGLTMREQREFKELEGIWREIDSGNFERLTVDEFFKKMKEW